MFSSLAGVLTVRGALSGENYRCHRGASCTIAVKGHALTERDRILVVNLTADVLDRAAQIGATSFDGYAKGCGSAGAAAGFMVNPSFSIRGYDLRRVHTVGVATLEGTYRVCLCADVADGDEVCSQLSMFAHEAGTLVVRGAAAFQTWRCVKNVTCTIDVFGWALTESNVVAVVRLGSGCGFGAAADAAFDHNPTQPVSSFDSALHAYPAYPDYEYNKTYTPRMLFGTPMDLRAPHAQLQWYLLGIAHEEVTMTVCYCADYAADNTSNYCRTPTDFSHEAGILEIRGPIGGQDSTCAVGRVCTVGPFLGEALEYRGAELVSFVPQDVGVAHCQGGKNDTRQDAYDPQGFPAARIADAKTRVVDERGEVTLGRLEVNMGGVWLLCFCASFEDCSQPRHFHTIAGILVVRGPIPNDQHQTCTAGKECTVTIRGQDLSTDDRVFLMPQLALRHRQQ
jgi:hypothetical protein